MKYRKIVAIGFASVNSGRSVVIVCLNNLDIVQGCLSGVIMLAVI